ncbi:zinc finger HIT domain-containing protein 3 [Odontomachus brunneus]|uniref:zinc finger HIT domain-containing protein 3 n=1 Tax=Odontomachus brunneus TaxID=486640 RepID=UPI0013F19017|nr:zinc finger HIT domain-containing protein 3 [Odontomachus brunneus]
MHVRRRYAIQFEFINDIIMSATKEVKICCICKRENPYYKCPTCEKLYCSCTCYKKHKDQACEPRNEAEKSASLKNPQEPVSNIKQKYLFPTMDTVPIEKLERLRHSNELKQCLANPHVRTMIKDVATSHDPTSAIHKAMREPIFVEFADICLKIVELPEENRPC